MSISSEGKPEFGADQEVKEPKKDSYDFMDTLRERAHALEEKLAKEEEQSINELQRQKQHLQEENDKKKQLEKKAEEERIQ